MVDDDAVRAYLDRLGVDADPPSPAALVLLHRAHVERIPYENLWIHLDQPWTTDSADAFGRIATGGRGGYCYHVNGALALLLTALGYRVTRHVSGVHGPTGPQPDELGNHIALIVHDLPTPANPAGRWWVDAGLGDSLHEPVPLVAGRYAQGPIGFDLEAADDGWHVAVHGDVTIGGLVITAPAVPMSAFAERHEFFRTSPDSPFVRTVTAQRRFAAGTAILRGRVLTRRSGPDVRVTEIADVDAWVDLLATEFGLRLDVTDEELHRLWQRVCDTHERWLASQAPVTPAIESLPSS